MLVMIKPDVALFVAQHPVWLHSNLDTLVKPDWDDDDDDDYHSDDDDDYDGDDD